MIRTVKTFFAFLALFILHRFEAWAPLSAQFSTAQESYWRDNFVGLLSDIWMAAIFSLPFWIFDFFPRKRVRYFHKLFNALWLITFGVLTAAHQGYVEYFRFQIIPFHLSYITDASFVSSNSGTLFGIKSIYLLGLTTFLVSWTHKAQKQKNKKSVGKWMAGILLTALICHVYNIKWRVNWFVVEPLQMNFAESLAASIRKKPSMTPNTKDELSKFTALTSQESPLHVNLENDNPFIKEIRSKIAEKFKADKSVIIGVILAESLREIDTGINTNDSSSITPHLNELQSKGVKFTNAFSSGPVTRGGQEAVWCGTPSATDTSIMRSFPNIKVNCIPNIFRNHAFVDTFWLHGGDSKFDSQLSFWKHQGVKFFLTKEDFPQDASSTGWGFSDLSLFDKGTELLVDAASRTPAKILMPMFLSVSNHIPWTVPSDASFETKNFVAEHPAFKTIKYFDESLDLFVGSLKEKGLWNRSIFVIVGDHGNLEMPWRSEDEKNALKYENMLSHVSLTVTGGIIEQLRAEGRLPEKVEEFVSQTQIAPFLEALANQNDEGHSINAQKPMDVPLFETSKWPIVADLNQYLFLPQINVKIPKEKILEGKISPDSPLEWAAMIRYRAWLEYLYNGQDHPPF